MSNPKFSATTCKLCKKVLVSCSKDFTRLLCENHSKNEEHKKNYTNQQISDEDANQYTWMEYELVDIMKLAKQNYVLNEFSLNSTILDLHTGGEIYKLRLRLDENEEDSSKYEQFVIFFDCKNSLEQLLSFILILLSFDYSFDGDTVSPPYGVLCDAVRPRYSAKQRKKYRRGPPELEPLLPDCQKEYQIGDITIKALVDDDVPSELWFDFEWRIGNEGYKKVTNPKYEAAEDKYFKLKLSN